MSGAPCMTLLSNLLAAATVIPVYLLRQRARHGRRREVRGIKGEGRDCVNESILASLLLSFLAFRVGRGLWKGKQLRFEGPGEKEGGKEGGEEGGRKEWGGKKKREAW